MIKFFTNLLFVLLPLISFSQGWLPMGAKSNSMANATVAIEDAWAFHHNPGALASQKKLSVGISYENRFLLKELQSQGFVLVQPLKVGVLSVGGQFYGFSAYRTTRVGAGYSMKLADKLSAGVQMNYQGLRFSGNYGSKSTVTAELGLLAEITEKWKIGMSVFNIGRNLAADYQQDRFTTLMRLGTSYEVSNKVLVTLEAEKNVDYKLRAKAGMNYEVIQNFYFRMGVATEPIEISAGFGYRMKSFQLDLGSSYHQLLGWSPHFSLTYSGKEK